MRYRLIVLLWSPPPLQAARKAYSIRKGQLRLPNALILFNSLGIMLAIVIPTIRTKPWRHHITVESSELK
jgi:hypothetical protein